MRITGYADAASFFHRNSLSRFPVCTSESSLQGMVEVRKSLTGACSEKECGHGEYRQRRKHRILQEGGNPGFLQAGSGFTAQGSDTHTEDEDIDAGDPGQVTTAPTRAQAQGLQEALPQGIQIQGRLQDTLRS